MVEMARTHAVTTPKSCQDRKVAAIRDACDRRGIRAFLVTAFLWRWTVIAGSHFGVFFLSCRHAVFE